MTTVVQQILTLAIIVVIGIILARISIMTIDVRKKLSSMLVYVVAPLYVIKSFQIEYSEDILKSMGIVVVIAFFIIFLGLSFGKILWRNQEKKRAQVLSHASGFMNCAFIGFPLIYSIYGELGVLYASVYVIAFQCFLWTLGVMIFTGKPEKWYKPLLQPGIIGVAIGLTLFILKIKLPPFLFNAINMVGSMTPPLAMLIIGAFLSEVDVLHSLKDLPTYVTAFFRLIFAPALVLLILTLLGYSPQDGVFFGAAIILAGMPSATNTVLFATTYDSDAKYSASVVAISTILAAFTIPLWLFIINSL
ncbi:MAG: AEC family transporter [Eubacteriales bacterium]